MRQLSRAFINLTSLATGVCFFVMMVGTLRLVAENAQFGDMTRAAILLVIAFLLFFTALLFALPSARQRLIFVTFFGPVRFLFGTFVFLSFCLAGRWLLLSPDGPRNPLLFGASQTMALAALGCLFMAVLITFLVPGIAYTPVRAAYREAQKTKIERSRPQDTLISTLPEDRRQPLAKVVSFVSSLAFVGVIVLAWYGFAFAQFISSASHISFVSENRVWIMLGFGIVIALSSNFKNGGKGGIKNPFLLNFGRLVFVVAFSLISIPAVQTGLPAVLSLQEDGSYDSIRVTVVKQGAWSSRNVCDRRATVVWEVDNRQLCNVPEQIWKDLQPGQILELDGFLTPNGFRYERMQRVS